MFLVKLWMEFFMGQNPHKFRISFATSGGFDFMSPLRRQFLGSHVKMYSSTAARPGCSKFMLNACCMLKYFKRVDTIEENES